MAEVKIKVSVDGASKVKELTVDLDKLDNANEDVAKSTNASASAFTKLNAALSALGVAVIVKQFISTADAMTNVNNQLKLVTSSTQELASAQKGLFDIAQKTRQDYASTAQTYANFAMAMGQMGKSQKEILRVTETVNKAIAISGGTAQQAAAATMQLGQAFASGTLRGDELNSILENSKGLAQAIADGMGVPIGKLRELGSEGLITSDILAKALERSADSVDQKFGQTTATVEQSMTVFRNQLSKSIEEFDRMNGISASVSGGIQDFTKYLAENGDVLQDLTRYMKEAVFVGGTLYGSVLAVNTITKITAALNGLTVAQYAFNTAVRLNPYVAAAGAIAAGIVGINEALTALFDTEKERAEHQKRNLAYNAKKAEYDKSYAKLITEDGKKLQSLEAKRAGFEKGLKNAEALGNKGAYNAYKAQIKSIDAEISAINKNVNKNLSSAMGAKSSAQKNVETPLIDLSKVGSKDKKGKEAKTGKSEAQREAERIEKEQARQSVEDLKAMDDEYDRFRSAKISRRTKEIEDSYDKAVKSEDDLIKLGEKKLEGEMKYLELMNDLGMTTHENQMDQINRTAQALTEMGVSAEDAMNYIEKAAEKANEEIGAGTIKAIDVATNAVSSLEDALVNAFMTGKLEAKDMVDAIVADMARLAIRQSVTQPLMTAAMSYFASANGNAFIGGNAVTAFASGGAFTNTVASSPTLAPMALFGEAGPEAIMPLQRTSDGKLGVSATPSNVVVNIENNSGTAVTQDNVSTQFDGSTMIVNVVLDAINRNKGGMRDSIKGVR